MSYPLKMVVGFYVQLNAIFMCFFFFLVTRRADIFFENSVRGNCLLFLWITTIKQSLACTAIISVYACKVIFATAAQGLFQISSTHILVLSCCEIWVSIRVHVVLMYGSCQYLSIKT